MASNTLELNAQNTLWTRQSFNSTNAITNTGTVLLVTDSINLGANWNIGSTKGEGAIEIMPITQSSSIGLGDTSANWNITRTNLQKLIPFNATTSITIGGSDRIGDISFTDATPLALNGAFKLKSGGGNITLNTSSSTAGVADININGSLVLNTTGNIYIGGQIQTTGNQTYIGNVNLLRDTTLKSTAGGIGSASNFSLNLGNLIIDQGGNSTLSGVLSGSQTLTKSGIGTLTLTGNNTYTGVTTISNGTLALGDGGADGDLASQTIVNNDELEFNSSADHTYTGIISGTGSLRKLGTGNLTLNATASDFNAVVGTGTYSSFTGNVFVDAGILKANNQQNSVNPSTSSLGNGAANRTITVNNSGILEF
jgi:autotransporter-associated beta strand protein